MTRQYKDKHKRNTRDGDLGVVCAKSAGAHATQHRQICKRDFDSQTGRDDDDDDDDDERRLRSCSEIPCQPDGDDDDDDDDGDGQQTKNNDY